MTCNMSTSQEMTVMKMEVTPDTLKNNTLFVFVTHHLNNNNKKKRKQNILQFSS